VEAVVMIAINSPLGALRGTEICGKLELPERYLESELQNLVHSGVLKSIRGPKGGYVLGREKRNISLHDILMALEKAEKSKNLSGLSKLVESKINNHTESLAQISLHDVLQEAREKGVIAPESQKSDFAI
jgi:Rrf2 family transcriptional regulator, iron-sulfur cluster assembly transcription factor